MAIEKDELIKILSGEGGVEAKATTLENLFKEDVEQQLTQIKLNKQQIKDEKTEEIAKRHALEKQFNELQEANKKLEKQLQETSPDEVKKIYEQRFQDASNLHATRESELQTTIDEQKARIAELETSKKMLECSDEFTKAIKGKNIAPDSLEDFKSYVLGENCYKFSLKPTGDGDRQVYATKEGLTIKQVTEQACNSTFGKNCILNSSSGGSAEGGSRAANSKVNPFITGNKTQQAILKMQNPALWEQCKREAGL